MIGVSSTGLVWGMGGRGWMGWGRGFTHFWRQARHFGYTRSSECNPLGDATDVCLHGGDVEIGEESAEIWATCLLLSYGGHAECSHSSHGALNNYTTTPSLRSNKPELFQSNSMARGKNMRETTCHFSVRNYGCLSINASVKTLHISIN